MGIALPRRIGSSGRVQSLIQVGWRVAAVRHSGKLLLNPLSCALFCKSRLNKQEKRRFCRAAVTVMARKLPGTYGPLAVDPRPTPVFAEKRSIFAEFRAPGKIYGTNREVMLGMGMRRSTKELSEAPI